MLKRLNWGLLLAVVLLVVLFISSSMTYHQQTSVPWLERVLAGRPFVQQLQGVHFHYAGETVSIHALGYFKFVEFFVRKGAHVATYFVLGLSLAIGLRPYFTNKWVQLVVTPVLVTGLAAYDEFHQMLTGDRTPLFQDVMLDTLAGLVAILIVWGLQQARKRGK